MSDQEKPKLGQIVWTDLTIPHAEEVRDFYQQVVGWTPSEVAMDGYADFSMFPPNDSQPAAGICHARGANADLPPQWLIYIIVEDLDKSIESAKNLGGKILTEPHDIGNGRFCVIQDPAGAVSAIYELYDTPSTE